MRGLSFLPILLLPACDVDPIAAHDVLLDDGLTSIVTSPIGVSDRPCLLREFFAVRYVASRDGRRVCGVLCARGENGQHRVLRGEFDIEARWRQNVRGAE